MKNDEVRERMSQIEFVSKAASLLRPRVNEEQRRTGPSASTALALCGWWQCIENSIQGSCGQSVLSFRRQSQRESTLC